VSSHLGTSGWIEISASVRKSGMAYSSNVTPRPRCSGLAVVRVLVGRGEAEHVHVEGVGSFDVGCGDWSPRLVSQNMAGRQGCPRHCLKSGHLPFPVVLPGWWKMSI
jgi:hypothetical protein